MVVPLQGLGITYLFLSVVFASFDSPLTRMVWPLVGNTASSIINSPARKPEAFTNALTSWTPFSLVNTVANSSAPTKSLSVGKKALIIFPPAAEKEESKYFRCLGTLMQIALKQTPDLNPWGRREVGRKTKSSTTWRHQRMRSVSDIVEDLLS